MLNDEAIADGAPALLQLLRDATHSCHQELDAGFSSINLASKAGFERFLAAHMMGVSGIFPHFREFAESELHLDAPDLPEMLRRDLADLGLEASTLPSFAIPSEPAEAAVCYVLAGSRLGIAAIGSGDYWAKDRGLANRYMEDRQGLAVWRALAGWMRNRKVSALEADRQCRSAVAVFELFRQALTAARTQAA